jgi:hypothetical protein
MRVVASSHTSVNTVESQKQSISAATVASARIVARITNKRRIARYVARYIRHPAVANTRLHRYDEKTVTFWYKDREGERHFVTMEVQEFIKALIQHIPDRNFKMIRYYGAYSRRTKRRYSGYLKRSLRQATFEDFVTPQNGWLQRLMILWL